MKRLNQFLMAMLAGAMLYACAEEDSADYAYGPEYSIDEVGVSVKSFNGQTDTIPASVFKLILTLSSENSYAQNYGLNPNVINPISKLNISLDNYLELGLETTDANKYFVVDDNSSYNSLYETIDQYLAKKTKKSTQPYLLFTNQTNYGGKYSALITTATTLNFTVDVTLQDDEKFSTKLTVVLTNSENN